MQENFGRVKTYRKSSREINSLSGKPQRKFDKVGWVCYNLFGFRRLLLSYHKRKGGDLSPLSAIARVVSGACGCDDTVGSGK